jgi:hypothetical protein
VALGEFEPVRLLDRAPRTAAPPAQRWHPGPSASQHAAASGSDRRGPEPPAGGAAKHCWLLGGVGLGRTAAATWLANAMAKAGEASCVSYQLTCSRMSPPGTGSCWALLLTHRLDERRRDVSCGRLRWKISQMDILHRKEITAVF